MTLEDYAALHPADKAFLDVGYREYLNRRNDEVESMR